MGRRAGFRKVLWKHVQRRVSRRSTELGEQRPHEVPKVIATSGRKDQGQHEERIGEEREREEEKIRLNELSRAASAANGDEDDDGRRNRRALGSSKNARRQRKTKRRRNAKQGRQQSKK